MVSRPLLAAVGVRIGEEERRRAEDRWLRLSQDREKRGAERARRDAGQDPGGVEDVIRQSFEPEFIEWANFLRFTFDRGQYALVGRERGLGRDVLRIEYYPTLLFREDDTPQHTETQHNEPRDEDEYGPPMNTGHDEYGHDEYGPQSHRDTETSKVSCSVVLCLCVLFGHGKGVRADGARAHRRDPRSRQPHDA